MATEVQVYGAQGPNKLTSTTVTPFTGLLKGAGGVVAAAVAGTDYGTAGETLSALQAMAGSQPQGARVALEIPTVLHPLAEDFVDARRARPAGIHRVSAFFRILDEAGLLEDLVDGCYFGTDINASTGLPVSLRGVEAAAMADHFTRGLLGLTATQATTAGIGFDIADTRTGTMFVDFVSAGINDLGSGYGVVSVIGNSGDANNSSQFVFNGTSRLELQWFIGGAYQGATTFSLIGPIGREMTRRSLESQIVGYTYGTSDVKTWFNGCASHPTPNKNNPAASVAQNRVSLFARNSSSSAFTSSGFPLKGTMTSWVLFARELTDAEAQLVTRALRCLRPEPVTLVIEGDSTCRELSELNPVTHWPYKLREMGAWGVDCWQAPCATSGMSLAAMATTYDGLANQYRWFRSRDLVRRAVLAVEGPTNDIGGDGATGEEAHASLMTILTEGRAMGFETLTFTLPEIAEPTWDAALNAEREIFNGLVRASHAAGEIEHLVDMAELVGSALDAPAMWYDDAHLSEAGNELKAAAIYEALGEP